MGRPVRTVVTIDDATGAVLGSSTVYTSPPRSEPPYVKLYFEGASTLRNLPSYCWPVLLWLLTRLPYANADPVIEIGPGLRKRAADDLLLSPTRVNHALADLVKCGVLLREGRSLYQFNPLFFARGEWKDVCRLRSSGKQQQDA